MPVRPADSGVIRFVGGACSNLGLRRRRNEDAFLTLPEHGLYAVADGMGGHPAGDVASRMVIDTLTQTILEGPEVDASAASALLRAAFAAANAALLEHALARPDHSGLGTTLTAVLIRGSQAVIGHIGDSRLYLVRGGACRQITTDHTWVGREVAEGRLTPAAARHHPSSAVLLRVLGGADAGIDTDALGLQSGDRLVLCTDGVSNAVLAPDFVAITQQRVAPADIARHLCAAADAQGGYDNSTAVVVDVS